MPSGETMVAIHTALLPFSQLPLDARKCYFFPDLQQPLLYLGQLCDSGFTATLASETVHLTKDGSTTLAGTRDHSNGIYFIPLQGYPNSRPPPPPYLHPSNQTCQPKPMYSPTVPTT